MAEVSAPQSIILLMSPDAEAVCVALDAFLCRAFVLLCAFGASKKQHELALKMQNPFNLASVPISISKTTNEDFQKLFESAIAMRSGRGTKWYLNVSP